MSDRRALAERLVRLARQIVADDADLDDAADVEPADEFDAVKDLDARLTRFKKSKRPGWWEPGHSLGINETLMGTLNMWEFTILPFNAAKRAYRAAGPRFPEGIVIDPNWASTRDTGAYPETPRVCEILTGMVKKSDPIEQVVRTELESIEQHFSVKIPDAIKTKLVGDSVKTAERRWDTDRLRRRNILVPFDGSKPITLGSWD